MTQLALFFTDAWWADDDAMSEAMEQTPIVSANEILPEQNSRAHDEASKART